MAKKYHLFEVVGIELEYMLVSKSNLNVQPIVDQLLTKKNGELTADIDNGAIAWSNELVAHVVELKTNGPVSSLNGLANKFATNVKEINQLLNDFDTALMPTAAHPLMDPKKDTVLWKHSYSEVYNLYNQIFDCSGHGWSNVQSTHINLPFYDDVEFEKLHAAIRIVLPLIPALFASSPIIEGVVSADKDARLNFYKSNQKEIPEMAGFIIPEQVFTKDDYHEKIFSPINAAIKPFDKNGVLDHHFLNSRGAIARFDRNAIEIRLADIQECPQADIGLCAFLIAVLKKLVNGDFATLSAQKSWHESDLLPLLEGGIKNAEEYLISNLEYLKLFGVNEPISMGLLWKRLFVLSKDEIQNEHHAAILNVLENGTLSTRILNELKQDLNTDNIIEVYKKLADCLMHNTLF